MSYQKEQIQGVRSRLQDGNLTREDVQFLDDLLDGAAQIADIDAGGGEKVSQLPYGLDVVK